VEFVLWFAAALVLASALLVSAILAACGRQVWEYVFSACGVASCVAMLFFPFYLPLMFFLFLALLITAVALRRLSGSQIAIPVLCAVSLVVYGGYWLWLPDPGSYHFGWDHGYKLKDIVLAIHNYADANGVRLPPAVVTDKAGRPLYSWRVAILPYLRDEKKLAAEFHFDEPWDSEHNKPLVARMPRVYRSPLLDHGEDDGGLTFYQAIVGPGTPFEQPGLTLKDFNLTDTFLIVEAEERVPWAKPGDLVYDPDGPLPRFGHSRWRPIFWWKIPVGKRFRFEAGMADGAVVGIPLPYDEAEIRSRLNRDHGLGVAGR
jgi:hypothetical protein